MPLESFSGDRYYLVEVIAFVLCHLKDDLMRHLNGTRYQFLPKGFEWVITVPAIWEARGKQMMREAAYLVRHACMLITSDTRYTLYIYYNYIYIYKYIEVLLVSLCLIYVRTSVDIRTPMDCSCILTKLLCYI